MSSRLCPVCGSRDAELVFRQSFEELAGRSLVDSYDVVCCRDCGSGFADGLPGPAEFEHYYAVMSKYEYAPTGGRPGGPDEARCRSVAKRMGALSHDREAPVLDIGCSTGALLGAFKDEGFHNVQGLDPAPACASAAQGLYGVPVRTGSAADIPDMGTEYGVVLLSAVLEHLLDPLAVLRDARKALNSEGLLFVEVPDVEAFAGCAAVPYQEFSVEHINFFSRESLTSLLGVAGYSCVEAEHIKLPWTSGLVAGVLHAVFRPAKEPFDVSEDHATRSALLAYVAASAAIEETVRARIDALADRGRPVLVWGVGTHTRHLLKAGALDGLRIVAYVDSDPKYQGAELRGVPVLAPSAVASRDETILISSGTLHHEIARQIREELGAENEIVCLYE